MAYEYKYGDKVVSLQVDDSLFAVRFREPAPESVRAMGATRLGVNTFEDRIELPGEKFTVFNKPRAPFSAMPMGAETRMLAGVARTTPVFRVGDKRVVATDRLVIGFKPNVDGQAPLDEPQIERFLKQRGYTILEKIDRAYIVRLDETDDPFNEIRKLSVIDRVEFAEPDFVTFGRHALRFPTAAITPNHAGAGGPSPASAHGDPLLDRQYAMVITRAAQAWAKTLDDSTASARLNKNIKIAILDEGVDGVHEDLNILAQYDATDDDLDQQPNAWDGHGTACAGLAAAKGLNDTGVRGVASGFPILAIRIALSGFPGADWVTKDSVIARGIEWAWRNGADVLSNSWGGGAPSMLITQAFERARTLGRNGAGCVIVIAAGNANTTIGYPATLPGMLVVTASNEHDEPKTPTSRDGENWWGSSFGDEACVAAPGVHNYTTDISLDGGYSTGGTDPQGRVYHANYTHNFNGTSSATPIVAGAAALLLAIKDSLQQDAVCDIIRTTADKVGGNYNAQGHDLRMGYGRLNVERAIEAVLNPSPAPPAPPSPPGAKVSPSAIEAAPLKNVATNGKRPGSRG